jgi:hypothetical protein
MAGLASYPIIVAAVASPGPEDLVAGPAARWLASRGLRVVEEAGEWLLKSRSGEVVARGGDEIMEFVAKLGDDLPWSGPDAIRADRLLREGRATLTVPRRSIAEELLMRRYISHGLRNSTGSNAAAASRAYRECGHYHWDVEFGDISKRRPGERVLKGHLDDGKAHNYTPHLQIHLPGGGTIIRIFLEALK